MDKYGDYLTLLLDRNRHVNLTAVRDPAEARIRHVEDSLALLPLFDFHGKTLLDVGSGAGVPGLILKIAEPSLKVTLLDATGKKADFLREAAALLALDVTCIHARAEEYAHTAARASFDLVTARGVTAFPALCEICLPFVKTGGLFLAMKEHPEKAPVHLWGGRQDPPVCYTLSNGLSHWVLPVRKTAPTPARYPRPWAKIAAEAKGRENHG